MPEETKPEPSPIGAAQTIDPALLLDTPKKALRAFLNAWKARQWESMYTACQRTWRAKHPRGASYLRAAFGLEMGVGSEPLPSGFLQSFGDFVPVDNAPVFVEDFTVPLVFRDGSAATLSARVIRESAPHTPGGGPTSSWGVSPLSALRQEKAEPTTKPEKAPE